MHPGIRHRAVPWLKKTGIFEAAKGFYHLIRAVYRTISFILGTPLFSLPDLILYRRLKKRKPDKLILVAHPDDETLFFSRVLLHSKKGLAVLCLTGGYDPIRRAEFYRALRYYGVGGYLANLPDQTAFQSHFNPGSLLRKLRRFRKDFPACKMIYTHNPEGEYGHRHHQLVSQCTRNAFQDCKIMVPVSVDTIENDSLLLHGHDLNHKKVVFDSIYRSQADAVENGMAAWFLHEKITLDRYCRISRPAGMQSSSRSFTPYE